MSPNESIVKDAALEWFGELGYAVGHGPHPSERLADAVTRYHANAITTAEVLQELIQLAKDIRAARQRGEESGLSDEEIAFL